MISGGLSSKDSSIHGLDPRARLAVCALFIGLASFSHTCQALCAFLAMSLVLVHQAKIRLSEIFPRLLILNLFVVMLGATMPGRDGFLSLYGGMPDGAWLRLLALDLRCNAILMAATALAGTIDTSAFGHALAHFKVPDKLTHLFLFTVGQTATMSREQERLQDAMRARAFRPRTDLHTYRSFANLAAILIVRSLERASRISDAMRCRNFRGRFHLFNHFKMCRRDWFFVLASVCVMVVLIKTELVCRSL